jgi:agmatine deiminase
LLENLKILKSIRNLDGSRFRIVELPMPQPIMINDQRMPASYANFYISNKFVIAPTFGDPNDQLAIDVLQSVFPDRKVIGLNARDLIWGLGAFHCITQQEPAAKPGP